MSGDYTVRLEQVFQGPMDLLLHLVREQEVEIHEIEISRVLEGYFGYLQAMEQLDMEVAGDFLVMATTLMSIKSRSLLPHEEVELEDELDPHDELIQRLIEYRRFKAAADDLQRRWADRSQLQRRGYRAEVKDLEPERTLDLGELTAWDLLATFSRLMRETLAHRTHHVRGDPRPLRWYVRQVGHAIHHRRDLGLMELLDDLGDTPSRAGLIGVFCALLELVKLGIVSTHQGEPGEEIRVRLAHAADTDLEDLIGATRFMDEEPAEDGLADGSPPREGGDSGGRGR